MKRVLIASQTFGQRSRKPFEMLEENGFEITENLTRKKYTEDELVAIIGEYDAVVVGSDPFTRRVQEAGKGRLKIMAKSGVGIDNIDLQAAKEFGIYVTSTPGTVNTAVADSAMGMILCLSRNIVTANIQQKAGLWPRLSGEDLEGKTLGIVGLGEIGKKVAHRAQAFGMEILAYDAFPNREYCEAHNIELCDLDALFSRSDYISLHAPLTPQTRNMVNDRTIALMKPTVKLVNTARGGLVDEEALYRALKEGRIHSAALDVFQHEPTDSSHPLLKLDNCIVTPHIAGYSYEANYKSGIMVAENIIQAFSGTVPKNLVKY